VVYALTALIRRRVSILAWRCADISAGRLRRVASALLLLGAACLPGCDTVTVGTATGHAGDTVTVSVAITIDPDTTLGGVSHQLIVDPALTFGATPGGEPDCAIADGLNAPYSGFSFRTGTCPSGAGQCAGVLAVVAVNPNAPLTSDTTLYSCHIRIAPATPVGSYAISVRNLQGSTPNGLDVTPVGKDGSINVVS
jgi:hypothetical protein